MDWEHLLCKAEYSMGERFRKTNGEESRQVSFTNLAAGSLVRFGGIVVNAGLKEDVLCQPEVAEYLLDELSSTTEEITYFGKQMSVTFLYHRQKGRLAVYKLPTTELYTCLAEIYLLLRGGPIKSRIWGFQIKEKEMLMLLKIPDKAFSLKNFFDQHGGNDIRKVVESLFRAIQTYHNERAFQVDIKEDSVIIFSPSGIVAFLSLWIIGYGGLEVKYQGGQRADIKQASSVVRRLLEEKGMKDHPIYYILDNVSELDTAASILMKISSFQNTIENVPIQESSGKILENGQKASEVVLEIEDTSITAMDLKSLELTLSDRDLIVLQNIEPNFERGSLSEGIMIGYFKCLKEEGDTTVQVITSEDLKSNVTEEQNILSKVCWILVPWNRNKHWALIAADVRRKELIYLDPVRPSGGENQTKVQPEEWEALGKVRSLLGWTNFNTILNPPDRSMQGDPTSCGVYVCFYARQLILGKPLGAKFSPEPMRREIEATLRSEGMWEGAGGRGFPQGSA